MKPARKIVVIGGGEIKDLETLTFDKRIVELTGKRKPKALFIPTASGEPEAYIDTFHRIYWKKLGCEKFNKKLINMLDFLSLIILIAIQLLKRGESM